MNLGNLNLITTHPDENPNTFYAPPPRILATILDMDSARMDKISLRAHQRIALNIFTLRDQQGLSQGELADLAGIDRKSINRIENQRLSPSIETLMRISIALGVKVSDLLN